MRPSRRYVPAASTRKFRPSTSPSISTATEPRQRRGQGRALRGLAVFAALLAGYTMPIATGLYDPLGRHAQLAQQVVGKCRIVGLQGNGLGHAVQPALAQGFVYWPLGVKAGDGNGAILLAE